MSGWIARCCTDPRASDFISRRASMACSTAGDGGGEGARGRDEVGGARGVRCGVAAAYGIDPVLFMLGAQTFGAAQSELDVAGGMMGRPVELTEAEFVSLPIPARAEFVVEGLLHPGDLEPEGPLGEF